MLGGHRPGSKAGRAGSRGQPSAWVVYPTDQRRWAPVRCVNPDRWGGSRFRPSGPEEPSLHVRFHRGGGNPRDQPVVQVSGKRARADRAPRAGDAAPDAAVCLREGRWGHRFRGRAAGQDGVRERTEDAVSQGIWVKVITSDLKQVIGRETQARQVRRAPGRPGSLRQGREPEAVLGALPD